MAAVDMAYLLRTCGVRTFVRLVNGNRGPMKIAVQGRIVQGVFGIDSGIGVGQWVCIWCALLLHRPIVLISQVGGPTVATVKAPLIVELWLA